MMHDNVLKRVASFVVPQNEKDMFLGFADGDLKI